MVFNSKMETAEEFIKRKDEQFNRELNEDKLIPFKDITRKGKFYFKREDWIILQQHNYPEKVFVFEKLKWIKSDVRGNSGSKSEGDIEYRLGYFIVGKIGNRRGKWTWGQYCPLIPIKDFQKLMKLAKEKGVIIE